MEALLQMDYELFEWINANWQNDFMDRLMPWWRTKESWIPLYIILIVFLLFKYKLKGFYLILTLAITVGVSDIISSKVIKPTIERPRPCKNPECNQHMR